MMLMQAGAVVALVIALFVLYRLLVGQKDATIELPEVMEPMRDAATTKGPSAGS